MRRSLTPSQYITVDPITASHVHDPFTLSEGLSRVNTPSARS